MLDRRAWMRDARGVTDKQILSKAMKILRARVKPENCARSKKQARAAAKARWGKRDKLAV